jgi:hypothetical protein
VGSGGDGGGVGVRGGPAALPREKVSMPTSRRCIEHVKFVLTKPLV